MKYTIITNILASLIPFYLTVTSKEQTFTFYLAALFHNSFLTLSSVGDTFFGITLFLIKLTLT